MTHGSYHSGIGVLARQIMVAGALPAHHSPGGHVIQAFMLGHISRFGLVWFGLLGVNASATARVISRW